MGQPQVSVVLPVWNGERYLRAALDSLLVQDFQNFEVVVVNDGSTDGTADLLAGYAHDARFRIHTQEPRGLVASLNRGLQLAQAEFIARMDADDVALPVRLSRQLAFMNAHPEVAAVGSSIILMDPVGRHLRTQVYPHGHAQVAVGMLHDCTLAHPAVMMRRSAVLAVGGYRQAFQHAEDYDLWLRIAERHRIDNLAEPLLCYRIHSTSVSATQRARQVFAALAARYAHRRRVAGLPDPFSDQTSPIGPADLARLNLTEAEESEFSIARCQLAREDVNCRPEVILEALVRAWQLRAHHHRGRLVRKVLMPGVFALGRKDRMSEAVWWFGRAFLTEPLSTGWMLVRDLFNLMRFFTTW